MSEYQYYEFSAVDQPLSGQQQAELRARSTRATITPGSFVNEYHWGDLKGDPLDWMQRYFDAHVYFANWGSARLPLAALDEAVLADFLQPSVAAADTGYGDIFTVTATATHWILDWSLCDDSGDYAHDWQEDEDSGGSGWMARLLPLRDELLRGDTRPLYLGWLARVGSEEIGDEDLEPPLPAGLKTLTSAQMALVEFLEIPIDWLTAAAANSADLAASTDTAPAIDAWLALQSPAQMRETLRLLLQQRGQEAERSVLGRFLAWQRAQQMPGTAAPSKRRTVAQIEVGCTAAERIRLEREKQESDALLARKRAERDKHLLQVAGRANAIWESIDKTLQRGTGGAYEQAEKAVQELSEALALTGRQAEFRSALARLMQTHDKRPAWVSRMRKAGLL